MSSNTVRQRAWRVVACACTVAIAAACGSQDRPESRPPAQAAGTNGDSVPILRKSKDRIRFPSGKEAGTFFLKKELTLSSLDGTPVNVTVGPRVLVVGVATWCPVSHQFVSFVRDKRIASMLAGYTLVFVLGDEWETIEDKEKEQDPSLAASPSRLKARMEGLKAEAGGGTLYLPSFLDSLPGRYYLHQTPRAVGMDSFSHD